MNPRESTQHRKRYMDGELTHSQYYGEIADVLGRKKLESIVPCVSVSLLRDSLAADEHLNNIPLQLWDRLDPMVRSMSARAGFPSWSLSDTVCVMKEVARSMAA